jgi:hypothetical protein
MRKKSKRRRCSRCVPLELPSSNSRLLTSTPELMKTTLRFLNCRLLLALALAATTGCSTLQYRTVQDRFETAVRADNERSTMPFTDAAIQYQAVAGELTPDYIAGLDAKLRPNAWTIRAVSQWRAGEFTPAVTSALEGQAEVARQSAQSPQLVHGRDSIILTMLPGLVEDSRIRLRFIENGPTNAAAHYDGYAASFRTALRTLTEAREKAAAPTPPEVIAYWNYQCWRVLQNWSFVIGQLSLEDAAQPNNEADAFVATALTTAGLENVTSLQTAMTALDNALPGNHPYRQLIELERQR